MDILQSYAATPRARQERIRLLLERSTFSSQAQLREHLEKEGCFVTQATLSRDLDELGAVKVKDEEGRQVYRLPSLHETPVDASSLEHWCAQVLVSVVAVFNQVVLRTPPGAAQLLAAAVDRSSLEGMLGSIAGDDAILVIFDSEVHATCAKELLLSLSERS
ncbi:MAG: arginine repressor [Actinomycetaceae bacterium]|nr:arginine repressor [Actinomycetaceae bacterium]